MCFTGNVGQTSRAFCDTRRKSKIKRHPEMTYIPDSTACTNKNYFENDVASHKVFDIWLDEFENQTAHEVGDVKTKFFVPRTLRGPQSG